VGVLSLELFPNGLDLERFRRGTSTVVSVVNRRPTSIACLLQCASTVVYSAMDVTSRVIADLSAAAGLATVSAWRRI